MAPERLGGLVADQPLLAGVGHDGDAVAGARARAPQALGGTRHQLGVLRATSFRGRCRSCLARNATASGRARARSSSSAGAVRAAQVIERSARTVSGAVHDGLPRPQVRLRAGIGLASPADDELANSAATRAMSCAPGRRRAS